MELAFKTRRLRTLCLEHQEAVSLMGVSAAEVLRTRIADLRAVTYLAELPVGRPMVVQARTPVLLVPLHDGWSLSMAVGHQPIPWAGTGELDETRVRRVRVEDISQ